MATLRDISVFFYSIRTVDVITLGLEKEFPAIILRLALLVHCGPRAFKEKSFVGPWVQTTGLSIIAGCASSVSITRCILYNILDYMHRAIGQCRFINGLTIVPNCMWVTKNFSKVMFLKRR